MLKQKVYENNILSVKNDYLNTILEVVYINVSKNAKIHLLCHIPR